MFSEDIVENISNTLLADFQHTAADISIKLERILRNNIFENESVFEILKHLDMLRKQFLQIQSITENLQYITKAIEEINSIGRPVDKGDDNEKS